MSTRWVIIDGYSLLYRMIHEHPPARGEVARRRLIQMLDKITGTIAERVTIVFDGRSTDGDVAAEPTTVEVLYSPSHQTADTVIERLVCSAPNRHGILVVTSDRAERHTVEAAGATTMSCGDFLEECRRVANGLEQTLQRRTPEVTRPTLGDFFPKSE